VNGNFFSLADERAEIAADQFPPILVNGKNTPVQKAVSGSVLHDGFTAEYLVIGWACRGRSPPPTPPGGSTNLIASRWGVSMMG
jgi:hypothetical protein